MNSKKIFDILITGFIIILLGFFCYQLVDNSHLREKKKELQQSNFELKNKVTDLETNTKALMEQIESLNFQLGQQSQTPIEDTRTCTFTRTFHYIQTLEVKSQENESLVVFQEFQSKPFILSIANDFGVHFEKDAAYEIKFTGQASNDDNLNGFKILSIKKTNKIGLDQIQESCIVEE